MPPIAHCVKCVHFFTKMDIQVALETRNRRRQLQTQNGRKGDDILQRRGRRNNVATS